MDTTTDISSPAYFSATFGVDAAKAAELSSQARFVSGNRGGGITSEAPPAPASPLAPSPTALSAQAEYTQLMADRREGKISTATWNATGAKREQELANLIAEGAGSQPAPLVQPAGEQHPYLGAPPSPMDYGLLHNAGELPEDQVTQITEQQGALGRLNLNRSVVQDVNARLRTYAAELEHATPDQVQSRVQANYSRFNAQCAREGIDAAQAEALIGDQLKAWSTAEPSVRELLADIVKLGDPTMLDYILQIAKHNTARR